ncbi:MAG TPA: selenium cofactor biosynthesis protein YqeC [Bellilinea sp.]|nr:selenium cofactor biosynthesis protein YqeC [Bellilinea sp.]
MSMRLIDGLRADQHSRIAFVGAGGKTTAMFSLARQFAGPVICLNTAHLAVDQASLADRHVVVQGLQELETTLNPLENGITLITGPTDERGRLQGVTEAVAEGICTAADRKGVPVLVEADGSRLHPLKAPATHEPPIPGWIKHAVVTVGLSGLGKPLDDEHVFRPEIFAALSGTAMGVRVTLEELRKVVLHPQGGLKNIPINAHKTLLANQLDAWSVPEPDVFAALNNCLPAYDSVLLGSVQNPPELQIVRRHEAVGAVLLAAGGSIRMGTVKQLLPWRGKPLVRHAAELALASGLNPVVVVTGAAAEEVEAALSDLPVVFARNEDWESGQASSVRTGIQAIPSECGAVLFLLSDMPQLPAGLIQAELELYSRVSTPIIVPRVQGMRTNPGLFDRVTFTDLMKLTGDTGGRVLFERYPVRWLDWESESPPDDIDTPADYQRLMEESNDSE